MVGINFTEIIVGLLILGVLYYLNKKKIITFTRRKSYKLVKGANSARMSYKYFDCIEDFNFLLKKNREMTLKYQAEVEEGKLKIIVAKQFSTINNAHPVVELEADGEGEYTFTTEKSGYVVRLEGIKTKGSCKIRFE